MNDAAVTFVGDVHGCYEELLELCQRCLFRYVEAGESVVFLGDLVDRGPQSAACVNLVRELQMNYPDQIECIMGNHEDWHLRYHHHEIESIENDSKNPMKMIPEHADAFKQLNESQRNWLYERPVYWQGLGFIAIHGGIPIQARNFDDFFDKKIKQMTMRLRHIDERKNMVSLSDITAKKISYWGDSYDGRMGFAVYGHQVFQEVKMHKLALGIDTGCCFGGKLTAARFIEGDYNPIITQIPARKAYFKYTIYG
jgi:hypothetical protein